MATVTIEIDGQTRKIPVDLPEGYSSADVQAQVREYLTKNPGQSSTTREANTALSGTGLNVADHSPPKPYALASPKDQAARQTDPRKALKRDIIPYEGSGSAGSEDVLDGLSSMATDRPATGAAQIAGGVLAGMGPFGGGRGVMKGVDALKNSKVTTGDVAKTAVDVAGGPKLAILKKIADMVTKKAPPAPAPPPTPPTPPQWGSAIPQPPQMGPNLTVNPAGPGPQRMPMTPAPGPGGTIPGGTAGPSSSIPMPPQSPPGPPMAGPSTSRVPGPMPPPPPPAPPMASTNRVPGPMPAPPGPPQFGGSTNRIPTPIKPPAGPPAPNPVLNTGGPPPGVNPSPSTAPPPSTVPGVPSTTASAPPTVPSTGPPIPPGARAPAEALKNALGGTPGQPLVIPGSGPGAGEAAHMANRTSLVDKFLQTFKTNSPRPLEEISKLSEPEKAAIRDSITSADRKIVGGPDTQKMIFERLGISPPAAMDSAPGAPEAPGGELPKFAKGGVVLPNPKSPKEVVATVKAGEDVIRGSSNIPLSPEGKAQGKKLGDQFKAKGGIDTLETSDLIRASDTAKSIGSACTCAPVVKNKALRPWSLGGLEGQPTLKVLDIMHRYITKQPNVKVPGTGPKTTTPGESFNTFKRKFIGNLREKLQELKKAPTKRIVLVTHYRGVRLSQAWASKGFPDSMEINSKFMLEKGNDPPGVVYRLYWKGTKPALEKVNMTNGKTVGGIYLVRHGVTEWNEELSKEKGISPTSTE